MSIQSALSPVDVAEVRRSFSFSEIFRLAFRLTQKRQRLVFAWLVIERVAVGVCDLLVAGSIDRPVLVLRGGYRIYFDRHSATIAGQTIPNI
jgi:hypothetical protein